ncbi:MAG: rod shape-determining protein MreC [Clostridiales bacterium]|nr:rod shape-determining protein MreC [Clostridiales bacterium]
MKNFFQKHGFWVIIAALFLAAGLTLGSAVVPNFTAPLTNLVGVIATPFRNGANSFFSWVEGVYDYAFRYEELQQKVADLEQEVAEMREENREAQDALDENERLRELLNLAEKRSDMIFEDATVTGRSTTSWESTLTLNKGSSSGVAVNQCVITETGNLVGVVAEVGTNWCTVVTIIDPDISVGAVVYRTNDSAMLESDLSTMSAGKCMLTYLSSEAQLIAGDEVLTSGETGIYPSGLVIGTVDEVRTDAAGIENYAIITPAVTFSELSEVFIVKEFSAS